MYLDLSYYVCFLYKFVEKLPLSYYHYIISYTVVKPNRSQSISLYIKYIKTLDVCNYRNLVKFLLYECCICFCLFQNTFVLTQT